MPPRRKPLLDLESELQGEDDVSCRPKLRRARDDDSPQPKADKHESPRPSAASSNKKKKEFAWMDSDAEDSNSGDDDMKSSAKDGKSVDNGGRSGDKSPKRRKRDGSRSPSAGSRSSSEGPPLPTSFSEVEFFSQMVRMADRLTKKAGQMETPELVQCLCAAARVKFYDGGFLQDLIIPQVRRQLGGLPRRKSPFTTEELVRILCSLADLNAFDKTVFAGTVRELADRKMELPVGERCKLLGAFKTARYECDADKQFYAWLSHSVKAERYEMMSAEQRMIVGNSKNGMHAPADYLRSFMIGTTSQGAQVNRPHGLSS